jgi:NADPH:quinone reductase-like Zn-dependent oxidoreductase
MSAPDVMKAIITTDSKTAKLASDVALPKLNKGEILVKVEAVTLNPTE